MLISSLAPSMAEKQGEDDEDDLFGDFKFVSSPYTNQNNKENDDDWGDFVATPSPTQPDIFGTSFQFQPSNGFTATQNPSDGFNFSQNFDSRKNSNTASDHSVKDVESKLNHVESGNSANTVVKSRWEKPRGALPLSIFGDEEDLLDTADQPSNGLQEPFSSKSVSTTRSGSNLGSGVNLNDLIVNLYGQHTPNGSSSNFMDDSNVKAEIRVEDRSNSNTVENGQSVTGEIKAENGPNSNVVVENEDFDGDDWEFKDAASENRDGDGVVAVKKDENALDPWVIQTEGWSTAAKPTTTTTILPNSSEIQESSEGSLFGFSNNAQFDGDWYVAPQGKSYSPTVKDNGFHFELSASTPQGKSYSPTVKDNGFHFELSASTANNWNADTLSQPQNVAAEDRNNDFLVRESFDSDESFGDFKDASAKTEATNISSEQKEVVKAADQAGLQIKELSLNDEIQENGKVSEKNRGALPLSIFSDGKLDPDESLFGEDVFSFKPTTSLRNGFNSQISSSNLSLNDLIFDLYSQADNVSAVNSTHEDTEKGFSSDQGGLNSNLANNEDDFDESSWEFKAAFSETKAGHSSSAVGPDHIHQTLSTEAKTMSFVDFYSRLKEESSFIILHHLDDLKNAQKVAVLSGEDAKAAALCEEIQTVCKKLHLDNVVSEDDDTKKQSPRNSSVNELLAAMEGPKFRVLDSGYHLSQRISLAEQNMESAIGLFQHAISVLKIMNLGSVEDMSSYTTTWSRIISTCARELKHGASIWKQSLHKNVDKQILLKSRGQKYILALGEIYRVAEVMRVSVRLYKPWILSSLADPMDIFAPLEECDSVWSNSGIDAALKSLADQVGSAYNRSAKQLLESIKAIDDLIDSDVSLLRSGGYLPEETCRLSLLPSKMAPGMKMVLWDKNYYFLTLANLWANLISCDPPKLPHIPLNS